ncbi:MAG TPA: hypothetical protein VGI74_23410 [Streptosporangiaceae bacterium]
MAAADRAPNRRLAHYEARSGFSHAELARAVTRRARAAGEAHICPDGSRVRRWLEGERPRAPVPRMLAEVFTERLGVPVSPADLGFPDPGTRDPGEEINFPWLLTRTASALNSQAKGDLMLDRHALQDDESPSELAAGPELLAAVQPWASAVPEPLPNLTAAGDGRIGMSDVAQIEQVTTVFRNWDNLYGGGLAREAIVGQLKSAAALLDGPYTEPVGRALFRAVADLASVAGFSSFDAGLHKTAQRYFVLGLHAAKEAGDKALGAHLLNCMSRQMGHLKRPADALELVQLAQYGARNDATATTRAMLHALEARYLAITGQMREFDRAVGLAEDSYAHADPGSDPDWVQFFDASEFYATIGICHQIAAASRPGHGGTAAAMIEQAISKRPAGRVRSRAFDHIGLARTRLIQGEYEGAATAADTALGLLGELSSSRVTDRLRELLTDTEAHAADRAILGLRDHLSAALS